MVKSKAVVYSYGFSTALAFTAWCPLFAPLHAVLVFSQLMLSQAQAATLLKSRRQQDGIRIRREPQPRQAQALSRIGRRSGVVGQEGAPAKRRSPAAPAG